MSTNEPLRIFIGYDDRQPISYNVLSHSLIARTTKPITIAPLKLETLPITRKGLTPFTYSRMLVPWLCDYKGKALFLDADILAQDDISKLFDEMVGDYDVWVSKNKIRFEWSSVVGFDCARCQVLTPEFVGTDKNPLGMEWARGIGELDPSWNVLVGYDAPRKDGKLYHFTQGTPCFPETRGGAHTDIWVKEAKDTMSAQPWAVLMGNSVHARPVIERLQRQEKERANGPA